MKTIRRIARKEQVIELVGNDFEYFDENKRSIDINKLQCLPPSNPKVIVCIHLNYLSRLKEMQRTQPKAPTYFLKPVSCLNYHKGNVIRPPGCKFLNYEGEIALVVGKKAENLTPEIASEYIAGYTIANDFGLHDFRETDQNSMVRVKGFRSLGCVGPDIACDWDYRNKAIKTYVDDNIVQESNTNDMIWTPEYLLADLSRSISFEEGDLILTGTPANSRPVSPGSIVKVEVEGLGTLENMIVQGEESVHTNWGAIPMDTHAIREIALGSDHTNK